MLPQGQYFGHLVEAGFAEAGEKETPHVYLTFEVTHVAEGGAWKQLGQPQKVDVLQYLSESAWPYTRPRLEEIGFNGDFAAPKFNDELTTKGAVLLCTIETYQNKTRERWNLQIWGFARKPLSVAAGQAFAAKWRTETAMNKKPSTAAPPPAAATPATTAAAATQAPPGDLPPPSSDGMPPW